MFDLSLLQNNFFLPTIAFVFIAIGLLVIRAIFLSLTQSRLNTELATQDNHALGISYASYITTVICAIGFIASYFSFELSYGYFLRVTTTLLAISVITFTGYWLHKRVILSQFNETKAILKRNIGAAVIDASLLLVNLVIAICLIRWVTGYGLDSFASLVAAFFTVQGIFTLDHKLREKRFAKTNQGASLQKDLKLSNSAMGIRYAGKNIGLACVVFCAFNRVPFSPSTLVDNISGLLSVLVPLWLILHFAKKVVLSIVLPAIQIEQEIDQQDNIGLVWIEFAVLSSIGYLLINLFAL